MDYAAEPGSQVQPEAVEVLSKFYVEAPKDSGYQTQQTLSGSRYAKPLLELPGAISLVNREFIADLAASNLGDVVNFGVSGVTKNQTYTDDYNIRGFRATQVLQDGYPLASVYAQRTVTYDVEAVEVIKGPAAMVLGQNADIGGVINTVTRKPTKIFKADASLAVSDHDYFRLSSNFSGPIIVRKGTALLYRLTIGTLKGGREKEIESELFERYVSGALTLQLGTDTTILGKFAYSDHDGFIYGNDFVDINAPINPVTRLQKAVLNPLSTASYSAGRSRNAKLGGLSRASGITLLTKLTQNADLRCHYQYSNLANDGDIVRGFTVTADNRTINRQFIPQVDAARVHTASMDFLHRLNHRWFTLESVVGLDGGYTEAYSERGNTYSDIPRIDARLAPSERFKNDDAYFAIARPGAGLPSRLATDQSIGNLSRYFQENISLWKERLFLVGGLRWFSTPVNTSTDVVTRIVTDPPASSFRVHKYGVILKPRPWLSIYYTDAQNVYPAQPGNVDLIANGDRLGAPLKASEGINSEYGIKANRAFSSFLSVYGSVAVFDMALTNVRTFGLLGSGQTGIIQTQRDSAKGVEIEAGARSSAGRGVLDLVMTLFDGQSSMASDVGQPVRLQASDFVPRKYGGFGKYTWTKGPLANLAIGVGLMKQSEKRNVTWQIETPLIANAFVRYAVGRWNAQINLDNLGGKRYFINVRNSGFAQVENGFRARFSVHHVWR